MRKELLVASIIGIGFGLIIAFGVYRVNSSLKPNAAKTESTPKPKTVVSEFKIALDKPQNNDVVTLSSTQVSGITKPLTWVTVSGEDEDYIIQSDEKGLFSQDVSLIAGINQIKITAFDSVGSQSVEKVLVVYSSSFEEKESQVTPTNSSTESAIRAKVEEKVKEAMNKPKAYIGVVTDIADSTIQIKTTESQIQQISIKNSDVTVIKTGGTTASPTQKAVKLTDIAIGDFIVAMGYVNSNSVLAAQRILITDPIKDSALESNFGKITSLAKKVLTVKSVKENIDSDISTDTKTDFISFDNQTETQKISKIKITDITDGDNVIYITEKTSDSPAVRTVFVIKKS